MGKTVIILNPNCSEEGIENTIFEMGRELERLGIPEGRRKGLIITLETVIPKDEVIRFLMLPRVKEVIREE